MKKHNTNLPAPVTDETIKGQNTTSNTPKNTPKNIPCNNMLFNFREIKHPLITTKPAKGSSAARMIKEHRKKIREELALIELHLHNIAYLLTYLPDTAYKTKMIKYQMFMQTKYAKNHRQILTLRCSKSTYIPEEKNWNPQDYSGMW